MSSELTIYSEEASTLVGELCALTAESSATVIVAALRDRLERLRAEQLGGSAERLAALDRALRASDGPGIPARHCWGRVEA